MSKQPQVMRTVQGRLGAYARQLGEQAVRILERTGPLAGLDNGHQISLLLCDNPTIHRLNRRWRQVDRPTDVLSFPAWDLRPGQTVPKGMVGDIAVSLPTVRRAARQFGLTTAAHMDHLLVHGLLHLMGYDHQTEAQARRMEAMEKRLLSMKEDKV